jgi:hypothetical protein
MRDAFNEDGTIEPTSFGGPIESNLRTDNLMLCLTTKADAQYIVELAKGVPTFHTPQEPDNPIARYVDVTLRLKLQSMNPDRFINNAGAFILPDYIMIEITGNAYPVHLMGETIACGADVFVPSLRDILRIGADDEENEASDEEPDNKVMIGGFPHVPPPSSSDEADYEEASEASLTPQKENYKRRRNG